MTSRRSPKHAERTLLATWALLMTLTLGSYLLAEATNPVAGATGWVLGIAAVKGHLIAGVFMEMRHAPRAWFIAMSGFLLCGTTLLLALLR